VNLVSHPIRGYCSSVQRLWLAVAVVPTVCLAQLSPTSLAATEGHIDRLPSGLLSVSTPKMRAVATTPTAAMAEIQFTYLGPTAADVPLASGAERRQIGLKLRAANPCNLVYVMWRIDPTPGIVVSVKLNPAQQTSAECDNGGYTNVRPRRKVPAPPISLGSHHTLRADLGNELTVTADGKTVWQGPLPDVISQLNGNAGIRTDNGRFEFEFAAAPLH
jgi:hypothetical protein